MKNRVFINLPSSGGCEVATVRKRETMCGKVSLARRATPALRTRLGLAEFIPVLVGRGVDQAAAQLDRRVVIAHCGAVDFQHRSTRFEPEQLRGVPVAERGAQALMGA